MNIIDINCSSDYYSCSKGCVNEVLVDNINNTSFMTIEPGKIKAAVTDICTDYNSPHQSCWVNGLLSSFAHQNNLELELIRIPSLNGSWALADKREVDIVATGIACIEDREIGNAQWGDIYVAVKGAIKIHKDDADKFHDMKDFIGHTIAVGKNFLSEKDLHDKVASGINIISFDTWEEIYQAFDSREADGIAEAAYYFSGESEQTNRDINNTESTMMIDVHDVVPGEIEGMRFVVSNVSKNLIENLNAFIKKIGMPEKLPHFAVNHEDEI